MSGIFRNIFNIPDLRRRIFFTVGMLFIFRLGSHIPVPGIDVLMLQQPMTGDPLSPGGNPLLDMLNMFSGGALLQFSIFGLGIMPYITSSIIMQLLNIVIPALSRLSREGEAGRKKIQTYTRYGTIVIAALQAYGYTFLLSSQAPGAYPQDSGIFMLSFIGSIVVGTVFLMWIGEQITERGLRNGISVLIFAGIIARLPEALMQTAVFVREGNVNAVSVILLLGILALVVGFVVYEQTGTRKIPIQFSKRVVGRKVMSGQSTHLPFKINPSGVIPIIFASAVIMFPAQIAQFFSDSEVMSVISNALSPTSWFYYFFYTLLVVFFAYFYTSIQYNPNEIADNLQKQGGFIPGTRPGPTTAAYIGKVLSRITLPGSIFLSAIALFPSLLLMMPIFKNVPPSLIFLMGGTSLLIVVSVDLDIMKRIESFLLMRHYDGFFGRGRIRGTKPRGM